MARGRSASVVVCMMVVLMVGLSISPTVAAHMPKCSKKPQTFVVYEQATTGQTTEDTTRVVTNSSLGQLYLFAEPTTVAVSAKSKRVGTTYGTITQLTGGEGSDVQYYVFDFHIDATLLVNGHKKVHFKGTLLAQGAAGFSDPNPTLAVIGGTGDFLYARGFLVGKLAAGGGAVATYAQKFTVWCESPPHHY